MEYQQILYKVDDPIATITLNRPKSLNAWTPQMGVEVKHAFAQAEADPAVVVIVLTGAGRGFCAGADLKGLSNLSEGGSIDAGDATELDADPGDATMGASFRGTYSYPMSIPKPVIAAINGPCAGMAVPIALYCDLRFAGSSASFTTAFSKRGLIAEWGISWILTRLVGPAHALDLLFSSRKIDAAEAERMGLVNRVLPNAELLPFVQDYAREMAANCSPRSMAIMKREVYQHMMESLEHAQSDSVRLMFESFKAPDFKEGVKSFLEKRPPQFDRLI
ncbi:MAG: enoyl-CoA hydratase [Myxococcales bacterium]|nr:enoyl-CoA hydratase [Myxococcales bacterium]